EPAGDLGANLLGAAGLGGDPFTDLPGRVMAHVLGVAAVQFGDPVTLGVEVEAGDGAVGEFELHELTVTACAGTATAWTGQRHPELYPERSEGEAKGPKPAGCLPTPRRALNV